MTLRAFQPALGDLLAIVDDPSGSPVTKKITVADLLAVPSPTLVTPTLGVATATSLGTAHVSVIEAGAASVPDAGDTLLMIIAKDDVTYNGLGVLNADFSTDIYAGLNIYQDATGLVHIGVGNAEMGISTDGVFMFPSLSGAFAFNSDRELSSGVSADTFIKLIASDTEESDFFRAISAPTAIENVVNIKATKVLGDNTTLIGGRALQLQAEDDAGVAAGTKGYLNGLSISLVPKIARNNTPFDDATALHIQNNGTRKGSDAMYVGHNASVLDALDWYAVFSSEANATFGVNWIGNVDTAFYVRNNVTTMADLAASNAADFVWKMAADNNDDATDQWIERIAATGNAYTLENNSNVNLTLSTGGNLTARGVVKASGGYQSSDGTAGATAGPFTVITAITVKNGLVTALTGS